METPAKTAKGKAIKLPLASLRAALNTISPALAGSTTIPVLKSVKIESGDGTTAFIASNLDLSIRVTTEGAAGGSGAFLMPSEKLLGYVKLLEGDEVSLTPGERRVTLKAGRATTQFPVLNADTFPATAFGADGAKLTLKQSDLLALLKHTVFAVSNEESRYTLMGALLVAKADGVSMVATDGHRLALFTVPGEFEACEPLLLPLGLLQALSKALVDDEGRTVSIGSFGDAISCELGAVSITHRKISGHFPNYQAVIPTGAMAVRAAVNVDTMLASLQRCVSMSDAKTCCVKMTFAGDEIAMKAVDAEAGETEETVEMVASVPCDKFTIGFNGHYLVDVLKRLAGESCLLEFAKAEGQAPLKLTHETEDGGQLVYVVMPMRV